MVAKARGDLFDVSVGGAGFHFTSHLIAIVALFIACFAIAGYISYRSDSIPGSALKDQDQDFDDITATTLNLSGTVTAAGYDLGYLKDVNTLLTNMSPANATGGTTTAYLVTTLNPFIIASEFNTPMTLLQSAVSNGATLTTGINTVNALFGTSKTTFLAQIDLTSVTAGTDFTGTRVDGYNFYIGSGNPGANNRTHTLPTPVAGQDIVFVFGSDAALDAGQTCTFETTNPLDNNTTLIDTATGAVVSKGAGGHSQVVLTSGGAGAQYNGFILFRPAGTSYQVISVLSLSSMTYSTA